MSREAMQMALDMLNEIADDVYCDQKLEGVIAVLRQALVDVDDTSQKRVDEKAKREHDEVVVEHANGTYTIRIPKRQWVGLTDEEVNELVARFKRYSYVLLREVEAKLKEKNT